MHTQQNCEVSLKDRSGLVVGKGILLSEIQTGDDVRGLSLFPHQVAIRIVEVYICGKEKHIEDGQVLKTCLGEIVRWSRSAVHVIDNVPEGPTPSIPTEEEFDLNDDMCNPNKNNMEIRTQTHALFPSARTRNVPPHPKVLLCCQNSSSKRQLPIALSRNNRNSPSLFYIRTIALLVVQMMFTFHSWFCVPSK